MDNPCRDCLHFLYQSMFSTEKGTEMKLNKVFALAGWVMLSSMAFSAAQACEQAASDESENPITILKNTGLAGLDTDSYGFAVACQASLAEKAATSEDDAQHAHSKLLQSGKQG